MMLRNLNLKYFTTFYHPCKFEITPQHKASKVCALSQFIDLYRKYAHYYAKLDPLQLYNKQFEQFIRPTDVGISFQSKLSDFQATKTHLTDLSKSVQQLENFLKDTYMGHCAVQFQHVSLLDEKEWLYDNYQKIMTETVSNDIKTKLAKVLVQAELLDHFIHKKFVTFKRYSGQGAQSTVLALNQLFQLGAQNGFEHIVFGMPHRGRLNTLVNIMDYPASHLFRKISGKTDTPHELYTVFDDVTSHIAQSVKKNYNGKQTKITMVHNPSHLQAQNPVCMGKARSKQAYYSPDSVLNIQVHGDAAFSGQGIVYQTFCLSKVPKFKVDGTIHLVTNNQIGYTTKPIDSRSSKYSCDIAKAFDVPIMHINSQNVEKVYKAMKLCIEYRKKFKKDILVDLVCYRKYGHNEVDEPEFTQPKMYQKIRKNHVSTPKKYSDFLDKSGITNNFYNKIMEQKFEKLEKQFSASKEIQKFTIQDYINPNREGAKAFTQQWKNFKPSLIGQQQKTGFDQEMLKQFLKSSVFYPPQFTIHPRIKKFHIDQRLKSLSTDNLNWATCQSLAFFSLIYEGYNLRFSGQDVERGTFSQRHINLTDQKTEKQFNPLQFFAQQQPSRGTVQLYNSPLTQNAAMSFEYGYSIDHPNNMVIWQAQFGDFFNTAQVVVDVFLTNSENKWLRQSSLTLVLPHGFDGAGPQHSSCRMERFLQSANSDGGIAQNQYCEYDPKRTENFSMSEPIFSENIQEANFSFVYPTKPANYFHVLRRQMKRNFRKPLVIAGPKTLLRHSACISKLSQMGPDSKFQTILPYCNTENLENCEVVILCSGKFVYDIQNLITSKSSTKTALFTIQQLFPFPQVQLSEIMSKCNKNSQIYWVQQQNLNGGAYFFVAPRISRILKNNKFSKDLKYVGKRALPVAAVGSSQLHKKQVQELNSWLKKLIE